jgi:uracil-DNA glycosylase family 4
VTATETNPDSKSPQGDKVPIKRKHPAAHCEDCELYKGGEFVPGDGPTKTHLMIIGEAPGANEARVGKPFIGESGQLLNSILRHYSMDRKQIRLTNACLCRDGTGATPSANALRACRPRLMEEIRDSGATKVLALGNSAAQSVLDTRTGVTSLRLGFGRVNEEELPGVTVYPTFHPAAALRVASFFPSIVSDFGKTKGGTFSGHWYEPQWVYFDDADIALEAIGELELRSGSVVVDIESDIEKDVSFDQPTRHRLLCVGIGYAPGKVVVLGEFALADGRVRDALRRYFSKRRIGGQNAKFDAKGLWAYLGFGIEVERDSMLLSYVRDERPGIHSLEYQGIEILGAPDWKHVLDKYKKPGRGYGAIVETDEGRVALYKYNAFDVHATDLIIRHHVEQIEAEPISEPVKRMADGRLRSLLDLQDFLCEAGNHLMYSELNGIGIDLKYNRELMIEYMELLQIIKGGIIDSIPSDDWSEFNPNSPKQVKEVVRNVFDLRLPMKLNQKKEYAETTDKDALEYLAVKCLATPAERFFRLMLEHRREAKLFGTYVKGIRKRVYRGRVNSTFCLHITSTGRLSSRNPNLQNIVRSRKIKRQFIPVHKDHVFVQGDFGQAELRTLCWLSGDKYLQDVFNNPNRDLFTELTPRLYGDVTQLDKDQLKELRIRVKAYVYGLSYGREAQSIALEFGVPVGEAERGMKAFFSVIPDVVRFREETRQKVLQGQDLVTPFGRHRRFWLITRTNRKDVLNEALAFCPQSIASDITLDAYCHVRPRLKGIGWLRNIVHDSILAECHRDNVPIVKQIIEEEMLAAARRVVGDYVKFKVDLEVGTSWGDLGED